MANALTFNFESHPIHSVTINGEHWFFAKDVCKALEIDITQTRKLDSDERGLYLIQTLSGKQEVSMVSESGIYALVLRCRNAMKPGTLPHRFRKWVTREVLPSIRKTGSYSANPEPQLSKDDLNRIQGLCAHFRVIDGWWFQYGDTIRKLNRRMAASLHDHFADGAWFVGTLVKKYNLNVSSLEFVRNFPFTAEFYDQHQYYLVNKHN